MEDLAFVPKYGELLEELLTFLQDEQRAGIDRLNEMWRRPLAEKLERGWSQDFLRLERGEDTLTLWAYLGENESHFRESDLLLLHEGDPIANHLGRRLSLELEEEDRWLLRGDQVPFVLDAYQGGKCYADRDAMDLTAYYERSLQEIATSQIGREIVLPLLCGDLPVDFDPRAAEIAERTAWQEGFNRKQAEAVGLAVGSCQVACIQGPPGTGKTHVLSLIARLLAEKRERILLTSHTHMAINNALNKIHAEGVPVAKIGRITQRKGLKDEVACYSSMDAWSDCPTDGYVVGATPFATCNSRLENYEFDTVIFDEASQVTVPLAPMAMRKAKKFVFIGDQKQLPPVLLSRSVLAKDTLSIFSRLTALDTGHGVMLEESYRMNRWLSAWPSRTFYEGKLQSSGPNQERMLEISTVPPCFAGIFDPQASAVFIPTSDGSARTRNYKDAELVADLCETAVAGGVPLANIGIVSPYRAQGRIIRNLLAQKFGHAASRQVIADTVERMQGQERELILLSLATGDSLFLEAIAEFFFQPERLNVSITRAKTKLIIIGPELLHIPSMESEMIRVWMTWYQDLIQQCRRVCLE
jgi:DNA replication ATP-dependent helicase/nuclease Dna2